MRFLFVALLLLPLFFIQPAFAQYGGTTSTIAKSLSFGLEGNSSFVKNYDGTTQYAPYH